MGGAAKWKEASRTEVASFRPRLDLSGARPPLGPLYLKSSVRGFQDPPCQPRVRRCLRAGCGNSFRPCCARKYYCSPECRAQVRAWSQQQAQEKYRASEQGRACRREQSRRYRERCRQRPGVAEKAVGGRPARAREGHQHPPGGRKICCRRPGCYNRFVPSPRSPLQGFCSPLCRQEIRRVRMLDARWQAGCAGCPRECFVDRLPEGESEEDPCSL